MTVIIDAADGSKVVAGKSTRHLYSRLTNLARVARGKSPSA